MIVVSSVICCNSMYVWTFVCKDIYDVIGREVVFPTYSPGLNNLNKFVDVTRTYLALE